MATSNNGRTISIASGETIALDLRNRLFPFGYVIRIPTGSTGRRRFSNATAPGNRFVAQPSFANVSASAAADRIVGQEMTPIAWLSVAAENGPASIDIAGARTQDIVVHSSTADAITAKTAPSVSVAVGATATLTAPDLFNYDKGAGLLDLNAVSADVNDVTASFDEETNTVTLTGVAATTGTNVTITATGPAQNSQSIVVSVEVTA